MIRRGRYVSQDTSRHGAFVHIGHTAGPDPARQSGLFWYCRISLGSAGFQYMADGSASKPHTISAYFDGALPQAPAAVKGCGFRPLPLWAAAHGALQLLTRCLADAADLAETSAPGFHMDNSRFPCTSRGMRLGCPTYFLPDHSHVMGGKSTTHSTVQNGGVVSMDLARLDRALGQNDNQDQGNKS